VRDFFLYTTVTREHNTTLQAYCLFRLLYLTCLHVTETTEPPLTTDRTTQQAATERFTSTQTTKTEGKLRR